jgi:UDP-N-acetylmuramoylalanine--D-glutamate ligase
MSRKKYDIVILGSGESGIGAAILAKAKGYSVFVSDKGTIKDKYKKELEDNNIDYEEGEHTESIVLNAGLIIKSPGIPENVPIVKGAIAKGIEVISEIEFAYRHINKGAKIIAITGSNGKTTTTLLTYHIFRNAGLKTGLGGNVGYSFARLVTEGNYDYYVLEISSFQLDGCIDFKPDIGAILNITPDHLDRYQYKLENYAASKYRIVQNFDENNFFVFNADDSLMAKMNSKYSKGTPIPFSLEKKLTEGAWIENDKIKININKNQFEMRIEELSLKGKHNVANSMVAAIAANIMKIKKETIRKSLMTFDSVEHRLENYLTIGGVKFINDSKATNINSTWYALETVEAPIVWIAGGIDKGNDYSELYPLVKKKVKALVCLGLDNKKLLESFDGIIPVIEEAHSMEEAVRKAYDLAEKGDTVLLSPACASFDLFENYEDRGKQFKKFVREL